MAGNQTTSKVGDHPLTDFRHHGRHPFAPQIERLLQEIDETEPGWLDRCPPAEQARWDTQFHRWAAKLDLADGIENLVQKLRQLQDEQIAKAPPPDVPAKVDPSVTPDTSSA